MMMEMRGKKEIYNSLNNHQANNSGIRITEQQEVSQSSQITPNIYNGVPVSWL